MDHLIDPDLNALFTEDPASAAEADEAIQALVDAADSAGLKQALTEFLEHADLDDKANLLNSRHFVLPSYGSDGRRAPSARDAGGQKVCENVCGEVCKENAVNPDAEKVCRKVCHVVCYWTQN